MLSKRTAVYPRVCGGTAAVSPSGSHCQGLSPRVRGNPLPGAPQHPAQGSIPACAGEPELPERMSWTLEVYPRVCGGTTWLDNRALRDVGLSPRVRGNRALVDSMTPDQRSIPACAGEPSPRSPRISLRAVYPRVCGGTPCWGRGTSGVSGLSPRVRGNQPLAFTVAIDDRSIPACAGEPTS